MKRLLVALAFGLGLCSWASADTLPDRQKDVISFLVGNSTEVGVGVSQYGRIYNTYGLTNHRYVFQDLTPNATDAFKDGGFVVSTGTLTGVASTYYAVDITTQPNGRNLTVFTTSSPWTEGNFYGSTNALTGTVTFYGIDMLGRTTSEAIKFSTSPARYSVGISTPGQGNVAFVHITSFTVSITSASPDYLNPDYNQTTYLVVGYGNKIGLPNDIIDPEDVYQYTEGQLPTTLPRANVNSTHDTVLLVSSPNNIRDYVVGVKARIGTPKRD